MKINRVFLIVLDSVGIGGAADAKDFGDDNPNTLKSIAASKNFDTPNLARLGLFNIDGINFYRREKNPVGAFARVEEASQGKDTTIGHWEIAGIISAKLRVKSCRAFTASEELSPARLSESFQITNVRRAATIFP